MWFDSWTDVFRILAVGSATYVALLCVLRLVGKRTLSQLNAFDLIVTIALGSTVSSTLLDNTVSWTEGVAAVLLLIVLQFLVALVSSHWAKGGRIVRSRPVLLLRDGILQQEVIRSRRLSEADIRQVVRGAGFGGLSDIAAVVLEANGQLSVVSRNKLGDGAALENVSDA